MEFYYHEADRDILVLRADGGLNHQTAAQFQAELERLVDAGLRKIIVDCSRLDHVSSYGLGVLIGIHNRLRKRGGDVKICSIGGLVLQMMRTVKLDRFFEIYPDVERARLMFRPAEET